MLRVYNLYLGFGTRPLVNGEFSVAPGEILALSGPSGCGKSTLLHWLLGAPPDGLYARGELWLNGVRCDNQPVERRHIGILFQEPLLFPHLSVAENLKLGIPGGFRQRRTRARQAEDALAAAGLEGFANRDPATLSGGQRGRVALLRALLARPAALLLDEPFAHLDAALRAPFRRWVFDELNRQQIPVVMVTHDLMDIPNGAKHLRLQNGLLVPQSCSGAK